MSRVVFKWATYSYSGVFNKSARDMIVWSCALSRLKSPIRFTPPTCLLLPSSLSTCSGPSCLDLQALSKILLFSGVTALAKCGARHSAPLRRYIRRVKAFHLASTGSINFLTYMARVRVFPHRGQKSCSHMREMDELPVKPWGACSHCFISTGKI